MELEVVCPDLQKLPFRSRDFFIDQWIAAAKKNDCDKVTFVLAERKIERTEVLPSETVNLKNDGNPVRPVIEDYLNREFPDNSPGQNKYTVYTNDIIGIAHTTTEDEKHSINVYADVTGLQLIFKVDDETVHIEEYPSPGLMACALDGVEFNDLTNSAIEWWLPTLPECDRKLYSK